MEYVLFAVKLSFKTHQNSLLKSKNDTELF